MRTILRRAAFLLLAAAAAGLTRPAAAQSPFLASPQTAPVAVPNGDLPPLPRVVPPDRAVPETIKSARGGALAGPPASATPTAERTALSVPPALAKPKVDLFTPPTLPAAWSATSAPPVGAVPPVPAQPTVTVAPPATTGKSTAATYPASMTPTSITAQAPKPASPAQPKLVPVAAPASPSITLKPLTPRPAPDHPLAASRSASPWPTTPAGPVEAPGYHPVIAQPAPIPAGVVASARPAPAAPSWPAAFQTRDESRPYETTGIVYFDRPLDPARPIAAVAPALAVKEIEPLKPFAAKPAIATPPAVAASAVVAPVQSADLRQRVQTACGHDASEIAIVNQPDKTVLVKVRVRDAVTEAKVMEKILQLAEMGQPTVHLQMEVRP